MTSLTLSGHQSFTFRNTWLPKGIFYLNQYPDLFTRDDAMVILGVGKNMVSSIRYWCTACQLVEKQKISNKYVDNITGFAKSLFLNNERTAWDPYLEDIGSLWLLHYLYVTNDLFYSTAFHVFNHYASSQFTRNELAFQLQSVSSKFGKKISPNTIFRDINTFVHTYAGSPVVEKQSDIEDNVNCPFKELNLLSHNNGEDQFFLDRSSRLTLPDEVFLFAVQRFINSLSQSTISVEELFYFPLSPGRVFRLSESDLINRLEKVEVLSDGKLILSETAGLRQLIVKEHDDPINHLEKYYGESLKGNIDATN